MPGLITHYICADVCLNRLQDDQIKKTLNSNRSMYNVGAQGPDVFFYYLPCLYRKSIVQLGNTIHKTKVNLFFEALVTAIDAIENNAEQLAALAYFAGYITHYALDAHTHPYIYYRSGFKSETNTRRKLAYSVNHRNFETNIDILMLQMISSEKPSDKKIADLVKVAFSQAKSTTDVLSQALHAVYGVKLSQKQVFGAFKSMHALNHVLQSKGGRRKRLMAFIENFTVGDAVLSSIIHNQVSEDAIDYLNLQKQPWHFPWEDTVAHTHAFTDLFEQAVAEANDMIGITFAYFAKEIDKPTLLKALGNRSLATGMDSNLTLDFRFSDVVFG